jgi:hypothetical protein
MVVVLGIVGICELIFGFGAFVTATTSIHEIVAVLMGGFAFLTLALAAILEELRRARRELSSRVSA